MQFKKGTRIVGSRGEKIGEISRVVIDPREDKVTHLVVNKGGLFSQDRVLPIDLVEVTGEKEIRVTVDKDQLDSLPIYDELSFVPLTDPERSRLNYTEEYIPPMYWYPVIGAPPMGYAGANLGVPPYPYTVEEQEHIPKGTVALKEGAKVLGSEGKHIGSLTQVLTSGKDENITHLVVSKGGLLGGKSRKLIPAAWIKQLKEDTVQLSVSADFVDSLKNY
jgi:uncharacterized protein YrrD